MYVEKELQYGITLVTVWHIKQKKSIVSTVSPGTETPYLGSLHQQVFSTASQWSLKAEKESGQ